MLLIFLNAFYYFVLKNLLTLLKHLHSPSHRLACRGLAPVQKYRVCLLLRLAFIIQACLTTALARLHRGRLLRIELFLECLLQSTRCRLVSLLAQQVARIDRAGAITLAQRIAVRLVLIVRWCRF